MGPPTHLRRIYRGQSEMLASRVGAGSWLTENFGIGDAEMVWIEVAFSGIAWHA